MKQCRKCDKWKLYKDFDKKEGCIGGVVSTCKVCRKKRQDTRKDLINARRRELYALNPSVILARNAAYAVMHKEQIANYLAEYSRANRTALRNYHRVWSEVWRESNRGLVNAKSAAYRAAKLEQTPKWLTEEQKSLMVAIYDNCPEGYEVDHIVPLRHPEVKGLHVPWNLQYLPMSLNRSFSNRLKHSQECSTRKSARKYMLSL